MIEKDQLARCLALKKKLAKKGKKASLTTLLLKKEYITKDQLEEIVRVHNERVGGDDAKAAKAKRRSRRSKRAKAEGDEEEAPSRKSKRARSEGDADAKAEKKKKKKKEKEKKDDDGDDGDAESAKTSKRSSTSTKSKRSSSASTKSKRSSSASTKTSKRSSTSTKTSKRRSKRSAAKKALSDIGSEVESATGQMDPALFQSAETDDVETEKRRLIGCPECGKKYRVRKTQVGKRFKCRRCKYRVKVPKDLFQRDVAELNAVAVEEFVLASSDQTGMDSDSGNGAVEAAAAAAAMVDKIGAGKAPSIRELAKAATIHKPRGPKTAKFGAAAAATLVACLLGVVGIVGGFYYVHQSGVEEDARERADRISKEFGGWKTNVDTALGKVRAGAEAQSPQAIGGSLAELDIARAARSDLLLGGNAGKASQYELDQKFDEFKSEMLVLKGNLILKRGGLRVGEAIADFQKAAALSPTHEPTQIALARTRIFARQYGLAAEGLKELAKTAQGAAAMRGYALERGDVPLKAAEAYSSLTDPLGPVLAARALVAGKEFSKAHEAIGKAKELTGADRAAAKIFEALALEGKGRKKQAFDVLDLAVAEGREIPYPRLFRGAMRLRQGGDAKTALSDIQKGNRLGVTAWGHYLEGEAKLALLNLGGALASYREALQAPEPDLARTVAGINPFEEPQAPDYKVLARCRLGAYENLSGKLRAAKIHCSRARNDNPFSPYAQAALTHLDLLQDEVALSPDSEELIRRALELSTRAGGSEAEPIRATTTGYLLLVYGGLLTTTSRYKEAVKVLNQAAKLDPHLAAASGVLQGDANKRDGQVTASRHAYMGAARSEAADPAYALALRLTRGKTKPKRLLEAAQALLLRNPYNAHAYMLRGQARVRNKEPKLALEDLGRAVAINPQFSEGFRARAYLFLRQLPEAMRDADEAGKDFDRAMAVERDQGGITPETFLGKARFHKAKLQPKPALRMLDQCVAAHPDFAEAYGLRAGIHKSEGNDAAYKSDLKRYRELTKTK